MGSRVRADGSGDSQRDAGLCAESSGARKVLPARKLECAKNLPERKRPPAWARLPALWHSFGGV